MEHAASVTGFLDAIGPDLYKRNAFRITGLQVDATPQDVRRRGERLRAARGIGIAFSGDEGVLPLPDAPDDGIAEQALQRLRDRTKRFAEEFFWFWSVGESQPDEALAALQRGEVDSAIRTWERRSTAVAKHDLAVLTHALALDDDRMARALWEDAFARWHAVLADGEFWRLVDERVGALKDPRLGADTTRRLRAALPGALLSINAELAVRAWRDDRRRDAHDHIALLHRSGYAQATVDEVLRRSVQPDRDRIAALCERAERDTGGEPAHIHEAARRVLDQSAPSLDLLANILPEAHPMSQGARDQVAGQLLSCAVSYGNETSDWPVTRELLERALALAPTEATATRINENLAVAKGNERDATCWFCQQRPARDAAAFEQPMYGEVRQYYVGYRTTRTTWRSGTIEVPRCMVCASEHVQRSKTWNIGCGAVIAMFLIACGTLAVAVPAGVTLLVLTVVGLVIVLATVGGSRMPPEHRARLKQFPPIAERLATGWHFGAKPPNVN